MLEKQMEESTQTSASFSFGFCQSKQEQLQPGVHQKVVRWSCHQLEEKTNGERSPKLQTLQIAICFA